MIPVTSERLALKLAAIDIASKFGRPAIRAAFTLAAAASEAEALADALAAALRDADAEALAANAAATLALIVPNSAASCDMASAFSKSSPSRLLLSDNAVVWASSGPSPGIGIAG